MFPSVHSFIVSSTVSISYNIFDLQLGLIFYESVHIKSSCLNMITMLFSEHL